MNGKCGKNIHNSCPITHTAKLIADVWTIMIIRDLLHGRKRFKELELSLAGISTKTLSERLASLEAKGLILRESFSETPPRVEYSLTETGEQLSKIIDDMREFGVQNLPTQA